MAAEDLEEVWFEIVQVGACIQVYDSVVAETAERLESARNSLTPEARQRIKWKVFVETALVSAALAIAINLAMWWVSIHASA